MKFLNKKNSQFSEKVKDENPKLLNNCYTKSFIF